VANWAAHRRMLAVVRTPSQLRNRRRSVAGGVRAAEDVKKPALGGPDGCNRGAAMLLTDREKDESAEELQKYAERAHAIPKTLEIAIPTGYPRRYSPQLEIHS
jgi:hypothetical protein